MWVEQRQQGEQKQHVDRMLKPAAAAGVAARHQHEVEYEIGEECDLARADQPADEHVIVGMMFKSGEDYHSDHKCHCGRHCQPLKNRADGSDDDGKAVGEPCDCCGHALPFAGQKADET